MTSLNNSPSKVLTSPRRKLYLAIAAQLMLSAGAHAAPDGGRVVGGSGVIEQNGLNTTITQNSQRLSVDWNSFDIQANERVEFVQPSSSSVALNRIFSNDASQIFGQLDANGHVILMNPNGIIFGKDATVNVGGLVASGLAINPDDFMNGDFAFSSMDGTDGSVINHGVINAATGGNVALIGKSVANTGLISAKLGTITLAAGNKSVLTFDDSGMLGVRVSEEVLQNELGVDAAVSNSGDIHAEGGKVLLTGSVSQDIFTQAVNAGDLNAQASVVMHDDGSFTLGGGADVVNSGTLNVASDIRNAGDVVVLGENVTHSGKIVADSYGAGKAGQVELHSQSTTLLTENSTISATATTIGEGGDIKVLGERVGVFDQSTIDASGIDGGGAINIGGGFQGKNKQLRNASRTVVTSSTEINANALEAGDGGDVVIWADQTTAFTGEINVRGGELSGDGGFVEVSGKENLKFDGHVDRTAVAGENGTLLLDPRRIIVRAPGNQDGEPDNIELDDQEILFLDGDEINFQIESTALSFALEQGDVLLQATDTIYLGWNLDETNIGVASEDNASSLILEAGGHVFVENTNLVLGQGNLIISSDLAENCHPEACGESASGFFTNSSIFTSGDVIVRGAFGFGFDGTTIGGDGTGLAAATPETVSLFTGADALAFYGANNSIHARGDISLVVAEPELQNSVLLPSGEIYQFLELQTREGNSLSRFSIGALDGSQTSLISEAGSVSLSSPFVINLPFMDITTQTTESGVNISAGGELILPSVDAGGALNVTSTAGDIVSNNALIVNGVTTFAAERDINLTDTSTFAPNDNVFMSAGRDLFLRATNPLGFGLVLTIPEDNDLSFVLDAGRLVEGATFYMGTGDFIASAGSRPVEEPFFVQSIHTPVEVREHAGGVIRLSQIVFAGGSGLFRASEQVHLGMANSPLGVASTENGSLAIYSGRSIRAPTHVERFSGGITMLAHSGAENTVSEAVLADGSTIALSELVATNSALPEEVRLRGAGQGGSYWSTLGSDIRIESGFIGGWQHVALDPSGIDGHGNISISGDTIEVPIIEYRNALIANAGPDSTITINALDELMFLRDFDYGNSGNLSLNLSAADIVFGVVAGDVHDPEYPGLLPGGQIFNSLEASGDNLSINASATGSIFQKYDILTGGGSYTSMANAYVFSEGVEINTENATGLVGNLSLFSALDVTLPSLSSAGLLDVTSTQGDIVSNNDLVVNGVTTFNAERDISLTDTSTFAPNDNVFMSAGRDVLLFATSPGSTDGYLTVAEDNDLSFILDAGRLVDGGFFSMGTGDFIASAGSRPVEEPFIFNTQEYTGGVVRLVWIQSAGGSVVLRASEYIQLMTAANLNIGSKINDSLGLYSGKAINAPSSASNYSGGITVLAYSGAENTIDNFTLADGSSIALSQLETPGVAGPEEIRGWVSGDDSLWSTLGGDITIESGFVGSWRDFILDPSGIDGHGNISITGNTIEVPVTEYSNRLAPGAELGSTIAINASDELKFLSDFDYGNSGNLSINLSATDIVLGVVAGDTHDSAYITPIGIRLVEAGGQIFNSIDGSGDNLSINAVASGSIFQKYDIFTGGGDYTATADSFVFSEGVQINTDYANATDNALSGLGNVTLNSGTDFELPQITTQFDCAVATTCGNLTIGTSRPEQNIAITSPLINILVGGDASFNPGALGTVDINSTTTVGFQVAGAVSVAEASTAEILARGDTDIGDVNVTGDFTLWSYWLDSLGANITDSGDINVGGRFQVSSTSPVPGGYANGNITLDSPGNTYGSLDIGGGSANISYQGDLVIDNASFSGGPGRVPSVFNVDGSVSQSSGILSDGIHQIFDENQDVPIIFDVTGDLTLDNPANTITALEIVNAQTATVTTSAELALGNVNADTFIYSGSATQNDDAVITLTDRFIANLEGADVLFLTSYLNTIPRLSINPGLKGDLAVPADATPPSDSVTNFSANFSGEMEVGDVILPGGWFSVQSDLNLPGTIRQADDTWFIVGGTTFQSEDVYLGGTDGSSSITITGGLGPDFFNTNFRGELVINGLVESTSAMPTLIHINGNQADNVLTITENSQWLGSFNETAQASLAEGNDTVNIANSVPFSFDLAGGNNTVNLLAPDLSLDLRGSDGIDTLNAFSSDQTWEIDEFGTGILRSDLNPESRTAFSDFDAFTGGDGADTFMMTSFNPESLQVISGGTGVDTADYSQVMGALDIVVGGDVSGGITSIETIVGNNFVNEGVNGSVLRINPSSTAANSWEINASDNSVTIAERDVIGFEGFNQLIGGAGDDTFNLLSSFDGEIHGGGGNNTFIQMNSLVAANIFGGEGNDTLQRAMDGEGTWTIAGQNAGTLVSTDGVATGTIAFTDVENLEGAVGTDDVIFTADSTIGTISTGAGNDTLTLAENISYVSIDGGAGTNTVALEGDTATVNVRGEAELLDELISNFVATAPDGAELDIVGLADADAQWVITGAGTVSVTVEGMTYEFDNVVNLLGNSATDTFVLQAGGRIGGKIVGQGETDVLRADNGQDNVWTINGANAGVLAAQADDTTLVFEGIANLIGGEGSDTFDIVTGGSITGNVRGLANGEVATANSVDELSISANEYTNTWYLRDGEASSVTLLDEQGTSINLGFAEVQTIRGNDNNDHYVVIGDSGVEDILAGLGANTFAWNFGEVTVTANQQVVGTSMALNTQGITYYSAASETFNNTFIGSPLQNTWQLSSLGGGTVTDADGGAVEFSGFNNLQGSGDDTLIGSDGEASWQIGEYDGVDTLDSNSVTYLADETIRFEGMSALVGGMGDDNFTVYSSIASIEGGAGANRLHIANGQNLVWNIDALGGTVTRADESPLLGFSEIQTVGTSALNPSASTYFVNDLDTVVRAFEGNALVGSAVSFANIEGAFTLDANGSEFAFTDIDTFDGNGVGSSYIAGGGATWFLSGDTAAITGTTLIRNFETLRGGAGNNEFVLERDATMNVVGSEDGVNTLIGGGLAGEANAWEITGDYQGTFNSALAFSQIQHIEGSNANDAVTFAEDATFGNLLLNGGDDEVTMARGVTMGDLDGDAGINTLYTGSLGSAIYADGNPFDITATYGDPQNFVIDNTGAGPLTIYALADSTTTWTIEGDGQVSIQYVDADGNAGTYMGESVARLEGGSGQDDFILLPGGALIDGISGEGGANSLTANNGQDNIWTINGANAGELAVQADDKTLLFEGIANLIGGANKDIFDIVTGGTLSGSVSGVLNGVDPIVGTVDELRISSNEFENLWELGATNSLSMTNATVTEELAFSNIQSIVGNDNGDRFNVMGDTIISSLDGGLGDNAIAWNNGDVGVDLANATVTGGATSVVVAGIANYEADAANNNLIVGWDTDNNWVLSGIGDGSVTSSDGTIADFNGFMSLQGGDQADSILSFERTENRTNWTLVENTFPNADFGDPTLPYVSIAYPDTEMSTLLPERIITNGFERLIGNAGNDLFSVRDEALTMGVSIDGGEGRNGLTTIRPGKLDWEVNAQGGVLAGTNFSLDYTNVQELSSGSPSPDAHSTFHINDINTIVTEFTVLGSSAEVSFANIADPIALDLANSRFTFTGITAFAGNGVGSEVVGSNTGSTWFIDTAGLINQDDAITYSNFATVRGGEGDDRFIVTGTPAVDLVGGEGAGVDTLEADDIANTWTISDTSGALNALTFTGMEVLRGGALVDTMTVAPGGVVGDVFGGDGGDTFVFGEGASIGNLNAGLGEDTVILGDGVVVTGSILGGDEADVVDTLDITAFTSAIEYNYDTKATSNGLTYEQFEVVHNPAAGSGFFGGAGDTRWVFTGANAFYIEKLDVDGNVLETSVTYTNEYDAVRGGEGRNAFILADDSNFDGTIRGGSADNNSLEGSNLINQWLISGANAGSVNDGSVTTVFSNIAVLIGGSENDTLRISPTIAGSAGTNAWNLGATNSVTGLMEFRGLETIVGNELDDAFSVTGGSDVLIISGGAGVNQLDFTGLEQSIEVNLQDGTAAGVNVEQITLYATDPTRDNRFVGMDAAASWVIEADDSGSVTYEDGAITYDFSGFTNLVGGADNDQITVMAAPLAGLTDGGAGINSLLAGNTANTWMLDETTGTLNGRTFQNVQSVTGGDGSDDFVIMAAMPQVQSLDGGLGDNSLTGFDQESTWVINSGNSGNSGELTGLARFTNIQSFYGGSEVDVMNVAEGASFEVINSGAGDDIVTIANGVMGNSLNSEAGSDLIVLQGEVSLTSIEMGAAGDEGSVDTLDLTDLDVGDEIADLSDAELIAMLGFTLTGHDQLIRPEVGIIFAGDGFNIWHITGENQGYFVRTDVDGNIEQVAFSGKHTLRGGTGEDVFVFANDEAAISQLIDGGTGENTLALSWEDGGDASVQNLINDWLISGENQGSLSNDANTAGNLFTGIANIIGGSNSDRFVFADGASLAGGVDGGGGSDTVDLGLLNNDLYVHFDDLARAPAGQQALKLSNINQLIGNATQQTVLLGASDQGYRWVIDGARSGNVTTTLVDENNQLLAFENVTAITGGDHDDVFDVLTNNSALRLDGGNAVTINTIDYSQVNANIRVALAELNGFGLVRGNNRGIDSINAAELVARDSTNTWTIGGMGDDINDGQIESDGNVVQFEDFNRLAGGAEVDVFNQAEGIIIGEVRGGAGNNIMNVTVEGINRGTTFIGGADNDTLNIRGASAEHGLVYSSSANGGQFDYRLGDAGYALNYEGVEVVNEASQTTGIEVNGTAGVNIIAVGDSVFEINNGVAVNHSNKTDVTVRGGLNDFVEISDNINLAGTFAVINASVVTNDPANTSIVAQRLLLENTRDVGAFNARIRTQVDDLSLVNVTGDVFLQEQNGLNLAGVTTSGELDLVLLNGNLTSDGLVSMSDDLRVLANDGNIHIGGANQLRGDLTISASHVEVHSDSTMNFLSLTANSATLISQEGISASGPVRLSGLASLSAGGNITMMNDLNDFNRLGISQAHDVNIVDQNGIVLADINTGGRFNLLAGGIVVDGNIQTGSSTVLVSETSIEQNGSIKAGADLSSSAANGDVIVAEGATTEGSNVNISATGNVRLQEVNGESITVSGGELVVSGGSLVASNGDINVQSGSFSMKLDTIISAGDGSIRIAATDNVVTSNDVSGNSVSISGNDVTIDGTVTADRGAVEVSANTDLKVNRDITASADVSVNSQQGSVNQTGNISSGTGSVVVSAGGSGSVVMGADAVTSSKGGSISVSAGEDLVLGSVQSPGTVTLNSDKGGIIDGNENGNNVTADKLTTTSDRGLGDGDALETNTRTVDSRTNSGDINIDNTGSIKVDNLITDGGNIDFKTGNGDVTLGSGSVAAKGGVDGSSVTIGADSGSVKTDGPQGSPTISGDRVTIKAPSGSVGEGGLNIDSPEIRISARNRAGQLIVKPGTDLVEYFSGSFKFEDQLLAVEPLEDVNPAVFTNIQGYFYNDISLRMPADQRFDEEEE